MQGLFFVLQVQIQKEGLCRALLQTRALCSVHKKPLFLSLRGPSSEHPFQRRKAGTLEGIPGLGGTQKDGNPSSTNTEVNVDTLPRQWLQATDR